jgi:hypothetical protein
VEIMTNPIFQEIDEDLERQRMEALWKKYGGWIIAAAAIVVLGTASYTAWGSWRTGQDQKATSALIDILAKPPAESDKEIAALQSFAAQNHGDTQGTFAQLHAASLAAKNNDPKKAVEIYDAIAGDTKADPAFRQLADLFSVQAQMDTGDPVSLQKRLQPLLADNAPWRFSAMEMDAFLALRAGDKAKAKQLFTELSQDASAPQSIVARATDMARFLDE